MSAYSSNIHLSGNTIRHNKAEKFGGAVYYASGGNFLFDATEKNNVYLNYAGGAGLDFFYNGYQPSTTVIVDTFTVFTPHGHFAYPYNKFNISLDHYIVEQTDSDLYVSGEGSDENSGASAADPLKTLNMAFMKILAGDTNPHTIYLDDESRDADDGEMFPVNLRSYVSLSGHGAGATRISGMNEYQLIYCYNDSDFSIYGLTLEAGYGEYGGALRFENGSSPAVYNVEIRNSHAITDGGGVYCNKSSPGFINVNIHHCSSANHGGGIMCYNYSNPLIVSSFLMDNFAVYKGGGIHASYHSDPFLDSCNIFFNTASHGGGIYINNYSDPVIKNSTISYNYALTQVSGYFGTGGALYITSNSNPVVRNTEIKANHADSQGGGIFSYAACYGKLTNCRILNNSAKTGGGMFLSGTANHTFYNLVLSGNYTQDGNAGGIYNSGSYPKFYNATITGNEADTTDGASYKGGALYNYNGIPEFYNSILWDNIPNEFEIIGGSVDATYCDIKDGFAGTGNIDSDPQLYSLYYLQENSPCIDAGNPDTSGMNLPVFDIRDSARIVNGIVDIGSFEFQVQSANLNLDLTVFLEGPFNGTEMNTILNSGGHVPLSQPYNSAPWNYPGTESVVSIPNTDIVDWILVELRDTTQASMATSQTIVARQACFLLKDGSIVSTDGSSFPLFTYSPVNSLFAVIWHRNSIGIMSANPLYETRGIYSYDFTSGAGQVYGGIQAHKEIAPGIWGMIGADGNADGQINNGDKNDVWSPQAGTGGYKAGDFNLDSQVNNGDKNDVWVPNTGMGGQVP